MSPKKHLFRKRFGQNFLHDQNVIQEILHAINPRSQDTLVEIGPGQGALTQPLLEQGYALDVIEIDRDLILDLEERFAKNKPLTIHAIDVLKFDFLKLYASHFNKKLRIIGNLPYNISTPLIFHLFKNCEIIEDMHFMLQKEVAERLIAKPRQKSFGRLSVMVQYYAEVFSLFDVANTAFFPAPKVTSSFVRIKPRLSKKLEAIDENHLKDMTNIMFQNRRKTIQNTLKNYLHSDDFKSLNLDPNYRAEQLSVEQFVEISNFIVKKRER